MDKLPFLVLIFFVYGPEIQHLSLVLRPRLLCLDKACLQHDETHRYNKLIKAQASRADERGR